ncbi:hypothetical protein AZE42_02059, partial [Rhizopogon vesiculosus]
MPALYLEERSPDHKITGPRYLPIHFGANTDTFC